MNIVEKKNEMFLTLTPQEVALLIESLGAQLADSHGGGVINQPFKIVKKGVVVKNIYIVQTQTTDDFPGHNLENEKKLITEWVPLPDQAFRR